MNSLRGGIQYSALESFVIGSSSAGFGEGSLQGALPDHAEQFLPDVSGAPSGLEPSRKVSAHLSTSSEASGGSCHEDEQLFIAVTGDENETTGSREEGNMNSLERDPFDVEVQDQSREDGECKAGEHEVMLTGGKESDLPPWIMQREKYMRGGKKWNLNDGSLGHIQSPFLRLHQEILDFVRFIRPTELEAKEREKAVARVTGIIKSIWPSCEVHVFGSYATGLYLPASDIDAVVLNSGCSSVAKALKALAKALIGKAVAKNLQVIAHARVPIVKFIDVSSGVNFDISFDVTNGPDAASFIQSAMATMPPLRPLCLILKLFLQQRGLNEVYTGGLGSYALLVMLMAHLQLHPSRVIKGMMEQNLGILLVDFFALYSQQLNAGEVGVSLRHGGFFFSKKAVGMAVPNKPYLLCIEDPQTSSNDLGKASFRIQTIRSAFKRALTLLSSPMLLGRSTSASASSWLLSRILRVDHVLSVRPVPENFDNSSCIFQGHTASSPSLLPQDISEADFPRNKGFFSEWQEEGGNGAFQGQAMAKWLKDHGGESAARKRHRDEEVEALNVRESLPSKRAGGLEKVAHFAKRKCFEEKGKRTKNRLADAPRLQSHGPHRRKGIPRPSPAGVPRKGGRGWSHDL